MSKMEGGVKINQLSDLQDNIKARDNTVLVFDAKDTEYRVGITYSSNKYNLIISYNDYNKWGQLVPGERLPLVTKTTKDDVLEYLSTVMKRLGFKEKSLTSLDSTNFEITNSNFEIKKHYTIEFKNGDILSDDDGNNIHFDSNEEAKEYIRENEINIDDVIITSQYIE